MEGEVVEEALSNYTILSFLINRFKCKGQVPQFFFPQFLFAYFAVSEFNCVILKSENCTYIVFPSIKFSFYSLLKASQQSIKELYQACFCFAVKEYLFPAKRMAFQQGLDLVFALPFDLFKCLNSKYFCICQLCHKSGDIKGYERTSNTGLQL